MKFRLAKTEILAVFYSERNEDFAKLIKMCNVSTRKGAANEITEPLAFKVSRESDSVTVTFQRDVLPRFPQRVETRALVTFGKILPSFKMKFIDFLFCLFFDPGLVLLLIHGVFSSLRRFIMS